MVASLLTACITIDLQAHSCVSLFDPVQEMRLVWKKIRKIIIIYFIYSAIDFILYFSPHVCCNTYWLVNNNLPLPRFFWSATSSTWSSECNCCSSISIIWCRYKCGDQKWNVTSCVSLFKRLLILNKTNWRREQVTLLLFIMSSPCIQCGKLTTSKCGGCKVGWIRLDRKKSLLVKIY